MSPTKADGYYVGSTRVPSVTTILNTLGWGNEALINWAVGLANDGKDWQAERQRAADIGTCAHDLIDCHLHGRQLEPGTYPDDILNDALPCFAAYRDWESQHSVKVIKSEVQLVSTAHRYGGCPDAIINLNGKAVLMDYKSSNWVYPKNVIQAVAYLDLIAENFDKYLDTAIILQIGKNGQFKTLTVEGETITQGREAFYHLLQLHKLKSPLEKLTRSVNTPGTVGTVTNMTMMGEAVLR